MKDITFVQQPTRNSCVSACLSMVTGIDVITVINQFHSDYHDRETTIYDYLDYHGVEYLVPDIRSAGRDHLYENNTYMITVPSLNRKGGLHAIVASVDANGALEVFDPQKGRSGVLHYVAPDTPADGEGEVPMNAWIVDAIFPH